ncbi:unnamed protein product [Leptidea sinapis]|uniref:SMB domain-containing protein n=1 Tax=Leptidea sinapis TaxID=189913 RepID=A0A5E4R7R3_9NEOP|nr:unnamed protein product [Leptidea sinapis]
MHGRLRMKQRGKLVRFICLPRYELVGNRYATCRNGEWDVPIPVCVRSGCIVPTIDNGIHMGSYDDAWVIFFCLPGHKLIGSAVLFCDGNKWNASAPMCIDSTAPPKLSCDFEDTNLCGWTQDEFHDFDWIRLNRKTPSSFLATGPSYDHTYGKTGDGYYMYIESTSKLENDTARLISPVYDSSYAKNGCFSFYYHMFGVKTGGLRVYQKPENLSFRTITTMDETNKRKYILFELWGNWGDVWYNSVTNLTDFSDSFQIVIEGIRGPSFTSDIAIDDVAILQGDDCIKAAQNALTPVPSYEVNDSCAGRCLKLYAILENEHGCGCTAMCLSDDNCCPDFFDECVFKPDPSTDSDDMATVNNASLITPFTQKLVLTTPSAQTVSNKYTIHNTPTIPTTRAITPIPNRTLITGQSPKSVTTISTTKIPAQRTTPKVNFMPTVNFTSTKLTTLTTPKTTTLPSTTKPTPTTTTAKLTTVKNITTVTKQLITTVKTTKITKPTTIKSTTTRRLTTPTTIKATTRAIKTKPTTITSTTSTTTPQHRVSVTTQNRNAHNELLEKAKKEQEIETKKLLKGETKTLGR